MEDETMEYSAEEATASAETAPSEGTKPHWRKTKEGKWALCGPQNVMQPGAKVEVFRRDDSSSVHLIAEDPEGIGKPFESRDVPGEMLVYAYDFTEVKE